MAWWMLCDDDPLLMLLRDTFGANPLRVPEQRIQPLYALATTPSGSTLPRGRLEHLLVSVPPLQEQVSRFDSPMAEVSAKETKQVDLNLGLSILEGFLRGFGVPSLGIDAALQGADQVSFSFGDVNRHYIDTGMLGGLLTQHRLDTQNPANRRFFTGEHRLLVVDSVIQSREFSMKAKSSSNESFGIRVPVIEGILEKADANVSLKRTSETTISFVGEDRLSFAFTCSRFYLDDNGGVFALDPEEDEIAIMGEEEAPTIEIAIPNRVMLGVNGLLSFDED